MDAQALTDEAKYEVYVYFCSADIYSVLEIQSIQTILHKNLRCSKCECVFVYTHYLFFPGVSRAEGGSEGGRAGLAVPRYVSGLRGAADGEGVDAVGVAVTVAAVLLPATVTRGPHEDGALSATSL